LWGGDGWVGKKRRKGAGDEKVYKEETEGEDLQICNLFICDQQGPSCYNLLHAQHLKCT
jgi:hypothetical protein